MPYKEYNINGIFNAIKGAGVVGVVLRQFSPANLLVETGIVLYPARHSPALADFHNRLEQIVKERLRDRFPPLSAG